jgi:hypothetical protein
VSEAGDGRPDRLQRRVRHRDNAMCLAQRGRARTTSPPSPSPALKGGPSPWCQARNVVQRTRVGGPARRSGQEVPKKSAAGRVERAAEPGGHRAHILRHTRCSRHARPHVARPGGRRESATEPDNRASSRRSRLEGRSGGGPGRKLQHFGLRNQDRLPLRVKRAGHWVDSDWSESRLSGRKLQDVVVPQVLLPTCRGLARSEGFGRGRTTTMPRPGPSASGTTCGVRVEEGC